MTDLKFRLLKDYLWLTRGEKLQRSVCGDYYLPDHRWGKSEFRIPGTTVEELPGIFAPEGFSDEDWALVNLNLDQEFDQ
jgi:hypothetical protein